MRRSSPDGLHVRHVVSESIGVTVTASQAKAAKRLREAGHTVMLIVDAMQANDVPVDSCILAAELAREAGRVLGYRARIFPVRAKARHTDGREGRDVGYQPLSPESVADNRYAGHVVCLWDDKVALDPTAPQLDPLMYGNGKERVYPEIEPVAFEVDRKFVKGGLGALPMENGWTVYYEPFDDDGDWARADVDATTRINAQRIGRAIAERVRPNG